MRKSLKLTAPLSLMGAVTVGALVGARAPRGLFHPGYSDTVSACSVTDGDTIRCGDERIRLLGIDAPELPGHCRTGRVCAVGDPYASSASLSDAMGTEMRIRRFGEDRYGRTLAIVEGPQGDLSCWQLRHHQAIYKPRWDNRRAVMRICPTAALRG